jgi:hypothetical protein
MYDIQLDRKLLIMAFDELLVRCLGKGSVGARIIGMITHRSKAQYLERVIDFRLHLRSRELVCNRHK